MDSLQLPCCAKGNCSQATTLLSISQDVYWCKLPFKQQLLAVVICLKCLFNTKAFHSFFLNYYYVPQEPNSGEGI